MSTANGIGGAHFFSGSSDLHINNSNFFAVNASAPIGTPQISKLELLRVLDAEVAPNAILNAGGRADPVRCFPGTREEVISKAERWMTVGHTEDRRIFWLSGPAGAGKSAVVQTLAENCIKCGKPMANFFFFRPDGSRNHSRPVVATLLHQLLEQFPGLAPIIEEIVCWNRLVFKKPLREQFKLLIDGPVRSLRHGSPDQPPIILLIDGLDECDSRADLDSTTTSEQRILLDIFHEFVMDANSPFIALIASRAEPHIVMAFNNIGRHQDSIYLNEDYRPSTDIKLFVIAELGRIKRTHLLGQMLDADWPFPPIIEAIVERSSGQFIYAATVARFISSAPESPAFTMEMVLDARPSLNHSPFAELDVIYTFILSRSKHWEQASEIIAMDAILGNRNTTFFPSDILGYSEHELGSFFSDLGSIIKGHQFGDDIKLTFHHASFNDFIFNQQRAGRFYINLTLFANSLAPRFIPRIWNHVTFVTTMLVLRRVTQREKDLTYALTHLCRKPEHIDWESKTPCVSSYFLPVVKRLYAQDEPYMYRQIFDHMKLQEWIPEDVLLSDTLSPASSKPRTQENDVQDSHMPTMLSKPKHQHWFRKIWIQGLFC